MLLLFSFISSIPISFGMVKLFLVGGWFSKGGPSLNSALRNAHYSFFRGYIPGLPARVERDGNVQSLTSWSSFNHSLVVLYYSFRFSCF